MHFLISLALIELHKIAVSTLLAKCWFSDLFKHLFSKLLPVASRSSLLHQTSQPEQKYSIWGNIPLMAFMLPGKDLLR